jgi:hypothetical protein
MRTFWCSLLLLALAGCKPAPPTVLPHGTMLVPYLSTRIQIVRPEPGLVCVVSTGPNSGGISCLKEAL